jgi:hypothetical protein
MNRFARLIVAVSIGLPCVAGANSSHCYNIRDLDWRSYCLTLADGQKSHCYNIKALDLRNQCLAGAGR